MLPGIYIPERNPNRKCMECKDLFFFDEMIFVTVDGLPIHNFSPCRKMSDVEQLAIWNDLKTGRPLPAHYHPVNVEYVRKLLMEQS